MIAVGRAVAAGVVAAVLWVVGALLGTMPIGARPLGWVEQVIVPGPLARISELPAPWPQLTVGAGALLLGALVAGAALLTRGGARLPIVWLAAAVGSLVVGAVMGVGTIVGEAPRLGVSFPVADVARDLGTQAWGLVLGWVPALVAGWSRDRGPVQVGGIATGAVAVVAALVTGIAAGVGGPLRFAALDAATPAPPAPSPPAAFSPAPLPGNDYALASTTCAPGALVVATTSGDGALGHRHFAIEIRNASTTTCTLDGYPAVGFRDGRGGAVAAAVGTGRSFLDPDPGATPVTLAPAATALATIGWDAGATSGDPTLAHELVLRIHAGGRELRISSAAFDIARGTAVTVQAWRAGAATPG